MRRGTDHLVLALRVVVNGRVVAAWLITRVEFRRRWPALLAVVLLVGVAGGAVCAAVAGARRTASSLERFAEATNPGHVQFTVADAPASFPERVARLPQVEASTRFVAVSAFLDTDVYVPVGANVDARFGRALDRPRLVAGRLADPGRAREVTLPESTARLLDVEVGDTIELLSLTSDQAAALRLDENADIGDPAGPTVRLRVVGIGRSPADLSVGGADVPPLVVTPAFLRVYGDRMGRFVDLDIYRVRLQGGTAATRAFVDAVTRAAGEDASIDFEPLRFESAGVQDSIDALSVGLWMFAAIAAAAGLVIVGRAVGRQVLLASSDDGVHRAIGMRPRERIGALVVPFALTGAVGGVLALGIALLASPMMPFGVARDAEPDPGLAIDSLVFVAGFVVITVIVCLLALISAWRVVRQASRGAALGAAAAAYRPSHLAAVLARAGAAPTAVAGARLSLERGRGKSAVPVRPTLVAAAASVAGVLATFVFAVNLDHLVHTPRSYGWNWDVTAGGPELDAATLVKAATSPRSAKSARRTSN